MIAALGGQLQEIGMVSLELGICLDCAPLALPPRRLDLDPGDGGTPLPGEPSWLGSGSLRHWWYPFSRYSQRLSFLRIKMLTRKFLFIIASISFLDNTSVPSESKFC
jgi:hypothetical protein